MRIDVNGNGNRVAGQNYYELRIKSCPCCELRVIDPDRDICNHCRNEIAAQEARTKMSGFALAVLVVFGWLMQRRIESSASTDLGDLGYMLAAAVGVVLLAICAYVLALAWFRSRW